MRRSLDKAFWEQARAFRKQLGIATDPQSFHLYIKDLMEMGNEKNVTRKGGDNDSDLDGSDSDGGGANGSDEEGEGGQLRQRARAENQTEMHPDLVDLKATALTMKKVKVINKRAMRQQAVQRSQAAAREAAAARRSQAERLSMVDADGDDTGADNVADERKSTSHDGVLGGARVPSSRGSMHSQHESASEADNRDSSTDHIAYSPQQPQRVLPTIHSEAVGEMVDEHDPGNVGTHSTPIDTVGTTAVVQPLFAPESVGSPGGLSKSPPRRGKLGRRKVPVVPDPYS